MTVSTGMSAHTDMILSIDIAFSGDVTVPIDMTASIGPVSPTMTGGGVTARLGEGRPA